MSASPPIDLGSPEALAALDLNLLVAFDALARERNVTRAAARVGVTQSAMSHALRRLREWLGDPLLVRGKGGMVLTPRAESLIVPIRGGLLTLGRAVMSPTGFTPATARRRFRLCSPDLFDVLVIPRLLAATREQAPGIDVAVVSVEDRDLAQRLETGELDVAIVPRLDRAIRETDAENAPGLARRRLLRGRFVCYARAGHPAIQRLCGPRARKPSRTALRAFADLSHALVSPTGETEGVVDHALRERGLERRVVLRVPHFFSALAIVARSDLVLTAPSALGSLDLASLSIATFPAPVPLPGHSVNMVWHERFSKDPAHTWLRRQLVETAHLTGSDQNS